MLKKIIYLVLVFGLLFTACTKQEATSPIDISGLGQKSLLDAATTRSTFVSDRLITAELAAAFAQKAIHAIYTAKVNSADMPLDKYIVRPEVSLVNVSNVVTITKDGIVTLYVVNFGTSDGYMVLSADKAANFGMLAYCDYGHFNLNELDPDSMFAVFLDEQSQQVRDNLFNTVKLSETADNLWTGLAAGGDEIDVELVNAGSAEIASIPELTRHKGSKKLAGVGVYSTISKCVWGQGAGYNADAKLSGALAGCPAVAIGMYCRTKRFPAKYPYYEMPDKVTTTSSNPVSRMFRDIADHIPNYKWGKNGSGAMPLDILTGLRNLGFSKAKMKSYDFDTAYDQIKSYYPVLLGAHSKRGGHIWICDGYWEQVWKVTQKFLGIKIKTWYEYADMLYMNWGWDGNNNGWVDEQAWPNYNRDRNIYYDLKN